MLPKLFMILIGCKPEGRHTEQHDIFFGIAHHIKDLIPAMIAFWPEADGNMHLDGWREVTQVDGMDVEVVTRGNENSVASHQLYFINLGGYKEHEFEEFHYKMVVAAPDKASAIKASKQTAFFKHTHFEGANSHIDDKYGVDVDDIYDIEEVLSSACKQQYSIHLKPATTLKKDVLHLGYFKLNSL